MYFGWSFDGFGAVEIKNIFTFEDTFHPFPFNNFNVFDKADNEASPIGGGYYHNIVSSLDMNYAYCGSEYPVNTDSVAPWTKESFMLVYDLNDLNDIKFQRAVTNFGQIIPKFQGYDTNHNFDVARVGNKILLGYADYSNGFHIFDITGDKAADPALVGFGHPDERMAESNAWYHLGYDNGFNAYQQDNTYDVWSGVWELSSQIKDRYLYLLMTIVFQYMMRLQLIMES